jgi:hypothetical protein
MNVKYDMNEIGFDEGVGCLGYLCNGCIWNGN